MKKPLRGRNFLFSTTTTTTATTATTTATTTAKQITLEATNLS